MPRVATATGCSTCPIRGASPRTAKVICTAKAVEESQFGDAALVDSLCDWTSLLQSVSCVCLEPDRPNAPKHGRVGAIEQLQAPIKQSHEGGKSLKTRTKKTRRGRGQKTPQSKAIMPKQHRYISLLGAPGLTTRSKKLVARTLLGTKGIASSNKCLTSSNKKLLVTGVSLRTEQRASLGLTTFPDAAVCIAVASPSVQGTDRPKSEAFSLGRLRSSSKAARNQWAPTY